MKLLEKKGSKQKSAECFSKVTKEWFLLWFFSSSAPPQFNNFSDLLCYLLFSGHRDLALPNCWFILGVYSLKSSTFSLTPALHINFFGGDCCTDACGTASVISCSSKTWEICSSVLRKNSNIVSPILLFAFPKVGMKMNHVKSSCLQEKE